MATQTQSGKAFEYACSIAIERFINEHPKKELAAEVIRDSCFINAKNKFESLPEVHQGKLTAASNTLGIVLEKTEPRLLYKTEGLSDKLQITIQPDSAGQIGDVRDIMAVRIAVKNNGEWQIGLSCKHNHDAIKHPRISNNIDIGEKWFGLKCDSEYWGDIAPIFLFLDSLKGRTWASVENKDVTVYKPLLIAVRNQIMRLYEIHGSSCTSNLLYYLIGKEDFYKAIVSVSKKYVEVQGFNLHGSLSLPANNKKALIKVNELKLPTKLYEIHFVEGSNNTIRIIMDEGWQISMRIHNARTKMESSLKMDVRLTGTPPYVFTQTEGF